MAAPIPSDAPLPAGGLDDDEWTLVSSLLRRLDADRINALDRPTWLVEAADPWGHLEHRPGRRVLLLDGPRGSGKTTLLQTVVHWSDLAHRGRLDRAVQATLDRSSPGTADVLRRVRFLPTIDFDPIPQGLPIPGAIVQAFRGLAEWLDGASAGGARSPHDSLLEAWNKVSRHVLQAFPPDWRPQMVYHYPDLPAMAVDRGEQSQFWLHLGREFRGLIDGLMAGLDGVTDNPLLLVLPIDDLDMQIRRTPETLWALSMLYHPRLVFLATGDEQQLRGVMRLFYLGRQVDLSHDASLRDESMVDRLSDAVVDKLIPPASRFLVQRLTWQAGLQWQDGLLERSLRSSPVGQVLVDLVQTDGLHLQRQRGFTYRQLVHQAQQLDLATVDRDAPDADRFDPTLRLLDDLARSDGLRVVREPSGLRRISPATDGRRVVLHVRSVRSRRFHVEDGAFYGSTQGVELMASSEPVRTPGGEVSKPRGSEARAGLVWAVELAMRYPDIVRVEDIEAQPTDTLPLAWTEHDGQTLHWPRRLPDSILDQTRAAADWARTASEVSRDESLRLPLAWLHWLSGTQPASAAKERAVSSQDWQVAVDWLHTQAVESEDAAQARWVGRVFPVLAVPELAWPRQAADQILRQAVTHQVSRAYRPLSPDWVQSAGAAWVVWEAGRASLTGSDLQAHDGRHPWAVYEAFVRSGEAAWIALAADRVGVGSLGNLRWRVRRYGTVDPGGREVSFNADVRSLLWFWIGGHGDIKPNACTAAISRLMWAQDPLFDTVRQLQLVVSRSVSSVPLLLVDLWKLWVRWSKDKVPKYTQGWLRTDSGTDLRYGGPSITLACSSEDGEQLAVGTDLVALRPRRWRLETQSTLGTAAETQRDALLTWLGVAQSVAVDLRPHPSVVPGTDDGFDKIRCSRVELLAHGDAVLLLPPMPAWIDLERGRWLWSRAVDRAEQLLAEDKPARSVADWLCTVYLDIGLRALALTRSIEVHNELDLVEYPTTAAHHEGLATRWDRLAGDQGMTHEFETPWWEDLRKTLPDLLPAELLAAWGERFSQQTLPSP